MKGWHNDSYRHSLAARHIRTSLARIPPGTLRPSSFWSSIKEGAIKGSKFGAAPSKTAVLLRQEQLQGEKYPNIVAKANLTPEEEYQSSLYKSLGSMSAASQRIVYFNQLVESVMPKIGDRYVDFMGRVDMLVDNIPPEPIFESTTVDSSGNKKYIYAKQYVKDKIMNNTDRSFEGELNAGEWIYAGPGPGWVPPERYDEKNPSKSGSQYSNGDDLFGDWELNV
jgi:hypothetical protein